MSNQRVVVLTEREILSLLYPDHIVHPVSALATAQYELRRALEHSEGITDGHVEVAYAKAMEQTNFGWSWPHPTQALNARWIRGLLEAALFPGDGER